MIRTHTFRGRRWCIKIHRRLPADANGLCEPPSSRVMLSMASNSYDVKVQQ